MSVGSVAGAADAHRPADRELPAIFLKVREASAQRLMMVYALTGLFFMLLPGTFLGVWNLIFISREHGNISPAWIQAHGHAQIFGWIGTFILGIGFYSIPKMIGGILQSAWRGWTAWVLWTAGALLRWITGVYLWHWRLTLPLSAAFEFSALLIFLWSVSRHRSADRQGTGGKVPVWVLSVLVGTFALGCGLVMNLAAAVSVSTYGSTPTYPSRLESRLLTMLLFGFIVPTIWGFSARWLPVFLGLAPGNEALLRGALVVNLSGVGVVQVGLKHVAPWLFAVAALASVGALHILRPAERPAKTLGIHPSFASFVRIAYVWLVLAAVLGIFAAYFDRALGWTGGSRHALTVGFISTMVFSIGQRVLPAFAGMRVLFSLRLMLACLLLLNAGCALRVASEILAYEGYWRPAWSALPWSAICELGAVTAFAANLLLTFKQPPPHHNKSIMAPTAV